MVADKGRELITWSRGPDKICHHLLFRLQFTQGQGALRGSQSLPPAAASWHHHLATYLCSASGSKDAWTSTDSQTDLLWSLQTLLKLRSVLYLNLIGADVDRHVPTIQWLRANSCVSPASGVQSPGCLQTICANTKLPVLHLCASFWDKSGCWFWKQLWTFNSLIWSHPI